MVLHNHLNKEHIYILNDVIYAMINGNLKFGCNDATFTIGMNDLES